MIILRQSESPFVEKPHVVKKAFKTMYWKGFESGEAKRKANAYTQDQIRAHMAVEPRDNFERGFSDGLGGIHRG